MSSLKRKCRECGCEPRADETGTVCNVCFQDAVAYQCPKCTAWADTDFCPTCGALEEDHRRLNEAKARGDLAGALAVARSLQSRCPGKREFGDLVMGLERARDALTKCETLASRPLARWKDVRKAQDALREARAAFRAAGLSQAAVHRASIPIVEAEKELKGKEEVARHAGLAVAAAAAAALWAALFWTVAFVSACVASVVLNDSYAVYDRVATSFCCVGGALMIAMFLRPAWGMTATTAGFVVGAVACLAAWCLRMAPGYWSGLAIAGFFAAALTFTFDIGAAPGSAKSAPRRHAKNAMAALRKALFPKYAGLVVIGCFLLISSAPTLKPPPAPGVPVMPLAAPWRLLTTFRRPTPSPELPTDREASGGLSDSTPQRESRPDPIPPRVRVIFRTPARPLEGGQVEMALDADSPSPPVRYEYRRRPGERWLVAEGGRITLDDLPPGEVTVEYRGRDKTGLTSQVGTSVFQVAPVRSIPLTVSIAKVDPPELLVGADVTIQLDCSRPTRQLYQYRSNRREEWIASETDRIPIEAWPAGRVTMQFRSTDQWAGDVSPVVEQTWTVETPRFKVVKLDRDGGRTVASVTDAQRGGAYTVGRGDLLAGEKVVDVDVPSRRLILKTNSERCLWFKIPGELATAFQAECRTAAPGGASGQYRKSARTTASR